MTPTPKERAWKLAYKFGFAEYSEDHNCLTQAITEAIKEERERGKTASRVVVKCAVEAEREACAKVADEMCGDDDCDGCSLMVAAAAIRARGQE